MNGLASSFRTGGGWLQLPRHDTVHAPVAGFDGFGAEALVPCLGCLCCAFIGFVCFFLGGHKYIIWLPAIQLQVATAHSYRK